MLAGRQTREAGCTLLPMRPELTYLTRVFQVRRGHSPSSEYVAVDYSVIGPSGLEWVLLLWGCEKLYLPGMKIAGGIWRLNSLDMQFDFPRFGSKGTRSG